MNSRTVFKPDNIVTRMKTKSSAVAERPRDALCPLVVSVSLNKIITRAESFIIVT